MSVSDNARIDEQFLATWNSHNVDQALALLAENIVWYDVGSPQPFQGKDAVRKYIQGWFTAFPDMKAYTKNRVITDDQVAAEVEFSGTHTGPLQSQPNLPPMPATGKKVSGKGTYFVRIRDGKIVEVHTYPDVAGMMAQLGFTPPTSLIR
ncbi:MAG: ester cyclase [Chloroflexi bacterium]|nr:ester cyclase [Chloroflexota bacterium]